MKKLTAIFLAMLMICSVFTASYAGSGSKNEAVKPAAESRQSEKGAEDGKAAKMSVKATPKSAGGAIDSKVTFKAAVQNAPSGKKASYQWEISKDGGKTWSSTSVKGSKTKKITVTVTKKGAGWQYRCTVKAGSKKAVSNAVSLFAVEAEASAEKIDIGKKVTFTASEKNIGGNAAYQWEYCKKGGSTWSEVAGAAGSEAALTVKTTAKNVNYRYRCKITGKKGEAYTNTVYVTPNPRYLALVIANSNYTGSCNQLPSVATDGTAMKKALAGYGWQVKLAKDLTAAKMESTIKSYFSGSLDTDTCLLYYSGHGDNSDGESAGSLVGVKYDYRGTYDLLYPETLRDVLLKNTRGRVIVLLDSCGSGSLVLSKKGIKAEPVNKAGKAKNFTSSVMNAFSGCLDEGIVSNTGELLQKRFSVLAACAHEMTSDAAYFALRDGNVIMKSGSAFTVALMRSMGCSYPGGSFGGKIPADTNGDGKLTLSETYKGIKKTVSSMNNLLEDYCEVEWDYTNYYWDTYHAYIYICYNEDGEEILALPLDQEVQMGGTGTAVLFRK